MGTSILKGITTGLLITVLTLVAVLGTTLAGFEENIVAYIVDFGLLLSCLAAGYRASRSSGRILPAALASGGYAVVGVLLLALYFPIDILGAAKIISEGTGLGLLAGILGTGILSSDLESYDRMDTYSYPRRENFYDRKDIYEIIRGDKDRGQGVASISYRKQGMPEFMEESRAYVTNPDTERKRIYELCNRNIEQAEEDEAFDWWKVQAQRQLKSR
jgi:hypothetical protein